MQAANRNWSSKNLPGIEDIARIQRLFEQFHQFEFGTTTVFGQVSFFRTPHAVLGAKAATEFVDEVVTVSDHQIREAARALLFHAKLAVEPSGAAALAAIFSGAVSKPGFGTVCCVVSGGNVDRDVLRKIV